MTGYEAGRIAQLSAELAVALKALDQIALSVGVQDARQCAQDALRLIRMEQGEWERLYLVPQAEEQELKF